MWIRPHRLLIMASILMDVVVHVDAWPDRGGDRLARRGEVTPGGAFNLATAARRLNFPVAYGGLVGSGPFGQVVQAALAHQSVPLLTTPLAADTGFDVAVVEKDGERSFITAPGAEARLSHESVGAVSAMPTDAVYVSGYDLAYPQGGALAEWVAKLAPASMVVLDPGPLVAEIPPERWRAVLARTDLLTLNRREAGLLVGPREPEVLLRLLKQATNPGTHLALREGAAGAYTLDAADHLVHVAAPRAEAVDTTGAGDVHTAVLVARLGAGRSWPQALYEANVAASWSVAREGPSASPDAGQLEQLLGSDR